MKLPSVEDVNSTRLTRFDDQITEALEQTERIAAFRDIIAHYVRNHDVPEQDVAAALAVVAQGETPLLLDPQADQVRTPRSTPGDRGDRDDRERPARPPRDRHGDTRMAMYRINVGKRHKVEPRQIVGALANEGGLNRKDFGKILIKPDFSLVELPADLPAATYAALADTRISGKLIELAPDNGPRARSGAGPRGPRRAREDRGPEVTTWGDDKPARKPRHKG
jgi:ATP-dependent RNA helicase DeaD